MFLLYSEVLYMCIYTNVCVCVYMYMCVFVRPKKSLHFESSLLNQSSETEYSSLCYKACSH